MRGLLVGRFQPFHRGHLGAIRSIRAASPEEELLLGIGSAQLSYTPENPFTAGERMEMILRGLAEARIERVLPVPLPDIDRHAMWVSYLRSQLPPFARVYTNNPLTRLLFEAERFEVLPVALERRSEYEGRAIREAMRGGNSWSGAVTPAVEAYLAEISGPERVRMLATSDRTNPHRRARSA